MFPEELTWTEVKAFINNDSTSIIIATGGTEQNGPHMILGKHNFRVSMAEKIAFELGDMLLLRRQFSMYQKVRSTLLWIG